MNQVMVSKEVAEAFKYHEHLFKNMPQETFHYILMAIPFSTVHGHSLVLKQFAQTNPTLYLTAILHGYEPKIDTKQELAMMIHEWLSKPYVDNEKQDIQKFASLIVDHLKKQT